MSILIALLVLCAFLSGFGLKRLLDAARKARAARAGEAQVERDTYRDERDAALAKVERLTEMLRLVEIKQPDGEGHVWASFTTPHRQSGAFNLGSADKFATKVALEFERLRCAALTSKE